MSAILEHVRAKGYTQAQLIDILDEYQPSVSNLLKGRISQVSIEKLLRYADRLHLRTSIAVRPIEGRSRRVRTQATASARLPAQKLVAANLAMSIRIFYKLFVLRGELAGIRTQDPRLKRALLYQLSYELAIRPLFQNYHKVTSLPFRPEAWNRSREPGLRINQLYSAFPSPPSAANCDKTPFTSFAKSFPAGNRNR